MTADHGAGAFAIHVEIADVKFFSGALDFFRVLGINGAGEAKFRVVGHVQSFVKILRFGDGENGPENLFLENPRLRTDVGNHSWLDEIAIGASLFSAGEQ